MEVSGEGVSVRAGERFEANNVERLERMGTVGWEHHNEDPVSVVVLEKLHREMTAVAVEYKELLIPTLASFVLRFAVKYLL